MNIELNQKPQLNKHDVISRFNLLERKLEFKKNISELLSGIKYEKCRINYDIHSDNFTMFIYLRKKTDRYIIPKTNDDKEWLCMGKKFKTYEETRL